MMQCLVRSVNVWLSQTECNGYKLLYGAGAVLVWEPSSVRYACRSDTGNFNISTKSNVAR